MSGVTVSSVPLPDVQHHFQGQSIDTNVVLFKSIRHAHEGAHVSEVNESNIDLLQFAKAVGSTAQSIDTEWSHSTTFWCDTTKTLKEHDRLKCYNLKWDGHDFLLYHISWSEAFRSRSQMFYVVSGNKKNGDRLLEAAGRWTSEPHEEVLVYDDGRWSKSKPFYETVVKTQWDNITLNPDIKESIHKEIIGFFDNKTSYQELELPWKRGLIFHGNPGNGKTLTIKALLNTLVHQKTGISCLYVSSFTTSIVGRARETSVQDVFAKARQCKPCVLVFEDLDTLVTNNVRSYFLNQVDGMESNEGILIIATANNVEMLDRAISERPSRFDRTFLFDMPGEKERIAYFQIWKRTFDKKGLINFPEELCGYAALLTKDFSFAYLKEVILGLQMTIQERRSQSPDLSALPSTPIHVEEVAEEGIPPNFIDENTVKMVVSNLRSHMGDESSNKKA